MSRRGLPADLSLRRLAFEDAEAMAALIAACDQTYLAWAPRGWQPPDPGEELARCRRWVLDPQRWSLGAFEPRGVLAGLAMTRQASGGDEEPLAGVGHLSALFVDPGLWGQGIATALLEEAEEAMRARGFRKAILRTPVGAPAEGFYAARGWSSSGETEYRELLEMWVSRYEKNLKV